MRICTRSISLSSRPARRARRTRAAAISTWAGGQPVPPLRRAVPSANATRGDPGTRPSPYGPRVVPGLGMATRKFSRTRAPRAPILIAHMSIGDRPERRPLLAGAMWRARWRSVSHLRARISSILARRQQLVAPRPWGVVHAVRCECVACMLPKPNQSSRRRRGVRSQQGRI